MRSILFFFSFILLSSVFPVAASAQENGYADVMDDYYDLHARRIDYYGTYIDHRQEIDERRQTFEAARQEQVENYRRAWREEQRLVNYAAGIAGNNLVRD